MGWEMGQVLALPGFWGDLWTFGILLGEAFFFLELEFLLITSSTSAVDFLFLALLLSGGDAPKFHSGDWNTSPSSSSSLPAVRLLGIIVCLSFDKRAMVQH